MDKSHGINLNFASIHSVATLTCRVSSDINKVIYISSDIHEVIRYRKILLYIGKSNTYSFSQSLTRLFDFQIFSSKYLKGAIINYI